MYDEAQHHYDDTKRMLTDDAPNEIFTVVIEKTTEDMLILLSKNHPQEFDDSNRDLDRHRRFGGYFRQRNNRISATKKPSTN